MTTVIQIENLSKKYYIKRVRRNSNQSFRDFLVQKATMLVKPHETRNEEFWALKDLFLDVREGERIGIIGRNGAGKSTLLKILSRITQPSTGRITMSGRVSSLLEVGTGFHPELTGRENIYLNGAILGMSRGEIKKKFDRIVDFAEITEFLETPVKRYSSGMAVRLAFAVAAHLEPEILIIDEVLAVGDLQFQKKCLGKIDEVSHEGRTILFVSHNMGFVQQLCERVIILEQGRKVFEGDTEKGISYYMESVGYQRFIDARKIKRNEKLSGDVVVLDMELVNNQNLMYQIGETLQMKIRLKGNKKVSNFHIKIILTGSDDRTLGVAMGTVPLSIGKGEEVCYSVAFNTEKLFPARYQLGVVLSKELYIEKAKTTMDYLKNITGFEIAPMKNDEGMLTLSHTRFGLLRLNELQVNRD